MSSASQRKSATHYVEVLIRRAKILGLDLDSILADTGVPGDLSDADEKWIDNDLLASLVKRVWLETNNETMGFDPTPLRIGTWSLACEFMLGGDTLGDLLQRGKRILSFLAPDSIGLDVVLNENSVALHTRMYVGDADPDRFLAEFVTAVWHRFPSWVIGETIQLNRAFFPYEAPQHAHFYDELFQCEVFFGEDACGFEFHRRYLQKPITRSSAELEAWLRHSPADLLYLPGRESSVQAHLKSELLKALRESRPFPSFDSICCLLHMSPQVVRRRLAEESTSYQKIKDAIRRDASKRLLSNLEMPVADVAERIGFSETAAFSRAFKKWTGLTPAQFRADITQ